MSGGFLNSIALIGVSVLLSGIAGWIAAKYWFVQETRREHKKVDAADHDAMIKRITELEMKLAVLSTAVLPISTAFQSILIKELTHLHTPRTDELMTKVGPPSTLTDAEEAELAELLSERADDMSADIADSERDAAHILPAVMRRATAEALAMQSSKGVFKIVAISSGAPPHPSPPPPTHLEKPEK